MFLRRALRPRSLLQGDTAGHSIRAAGFVSSAMRWSHDGAVIVLQPGADDDTLRRMHVAIGS